MIILWHLKSGIKMLIHNKDDIQFVIEFPCFLGHPVETICQTLSLTGQRSANKQTKVFENHRQISLTDFINRFR